MQDNFFSNESSHFGSKINVLAFIVLETGTYGDQFRRSYVTNTDGHSLSIIGSRVAGAKAFTPSLFSGVANHFIQPSANPESELLIPHGWQQRRLRFMLKLQHTSYTGDVVEQVVTGWGEHNEGLSMQSNQLDPDMEFVVNSTVHLAHKRQNTPLGMQQYTNVVDNSHVLAAGDWGGFYTDQSRKEQRMRPEDVHTIMTAADVMKEEPDMFDGRIANTQMAVKSRRSNGVATEYMARIMDSSRRAQALSQFGQSEEHISTQARGMVAENLVAEDPFLEALGKIRGSFTTNRFTWKDLLALDPNARNVFYPQVLGHTERAMSDFRNNSNEWHAPDRATQVATILSQAIPGYMMDSAISVAYIQATNKNKQFGELMPAVAITNVESFASGNLETEIERLRIAIQDQLLRDLSYNDSSSYNIEMHVDLLGDTRIRLEWEGYDCGEFVTPSFADALMVPVLTADNHRAATVASDFSLLYHNVGQPSLDQQSNAFGNI